MPNEIDSPEKIKNIETPDNSLNGQLGFLKGIIPFAGVIGLFIASFLTVYLLIIPQYNAYKSLGLDLEAERVKLSGVQDRLNYLKSLYDLRDQLEANIQLASQAIPDNKDKIPSVLDQLLQIADVAGVEIQSQSLAGIVVTDDPLKPNMVKIQMQLSGQKPQLIDFIKIVGENRTIINVENFSINQLSEKVEGSDSVLYSYDLSLILVTYYMEDYESTEELETQKPFVGLDAVIAEIQSMKYYEPRQSDVQIGRDDPFLNVPVISEEQAASEAQEQESQQTEQPEETGIIEN